MLWNILWQNYSCFYRFVENPTLTWIVKNPILQMKDTISIELIKGYQKSDDPKIMCFVITYKGFYEFIRYALAIVETFYWI